MEKWRSYGEGGSVKKVEGCEGRGRLEEEEEEVWTFYLCG